MTKAAPSVTDFQWEWSHHYGQQLPIGWHLRQNKDQPWVRFHALPLSKRYAEDIAEREIILSRANFLGDNILGPGNMCWIVEARGDASDGSGEFWMESAEDDDPNSPVWRFYVRDEEWQSGRYDAKLLDIADDGPNRAIWMRRDNGSVFAPYDGGFDLFLPTWQKVEAIKMERQDWLSDHWEGL